MRTQLDLTSKALGRVESGGSKLDKLGSFGVAGAAGLLLMGRAGLKAAGDMESTKVGYKTLLGSTEKANKLYKEVSKFSLVSPFSNAETAKSATALLATGVAADKVIPTMHAVGNAVASVGGNTEKFQGVMTILNKMRLRSKVSSTQLNQLALRGINPFKILQKELGLTADEVANIGRTGIKGSVAVDALLKGFEKIGNGKAMENLNKTYGGQLSQFEDARDQFNASAGSLILPDATKFLSGMTQATQSLKDFTDNNPALAKTGIYLAAGGVGAALLGSKLYKLYSTVKMTQAATKALAAATRDDDVAEKAKALTAGKEAKAIDLTKKASLGAADAKNKLGKATLGSRLKGLSSMPIGGLKTIPMPSAGVASGPVTLGGAAASLALGAGAGIGARNDMKALGYTDGQSKLYGGIVGAVTTGAAAFFPPARLMILGAEALRYGINKGINAPQEKAANQGNGLNGQETAAQATMTNREKADQFFALADKKRKRAAEITNQNLFAFNGNDALKAEELNREAETFQRSGNAMLSRDRKKGVVGSPEYMAQLRARGEEFQKLHGPQIDSGPGLLISNRAGTPGPETYRGSEPMQQGYAERDQKAREAYEARSPQLKAEVTGQTRRRDNVQTMTVKLQVAEGPGDAMARATSFRAKAPRRRM